MPDPIVTQFVQSYGRLRTPEERETAKAQFVSELERAGGTSLATYNRTVEAGRLLNEDLTGYISSFQKTTVTPPPLASVQQALGEVAEQAPWYKRTTALVLGSLDKYQKNVVEPTAATAVITALGLVPGRQTLERNVENELRAEAAGRNIALRDLSLLDRFRASGEAYRKTNMVWGMKGAVELVFDPLNLVGVGIPGKLATKFPALRSVLLPLQAIDQLPNAVTERALRLPGAVVRRTPGLRVLAEPTAATKAVQVRNQVQAEMRSLFGVAGLHSNLPSDTRQLLDNTAQFPTGAGPYSVRNVLGHLEDIMGPDKFEGWLDEVKELTPLEASLRVAETVALQEQLARKKGGTLISGEVLEGTARERRVEKLTSIVERLAQDERWSKAIAEGIDSTLATFESKWLRWIEPNVIRPWTLLHLASAGYLPMNLVEDVGISTTFLGVLPTGVSDELWNTQTAGLVGEGITPPAFLNQTEKELRDTSLQLSGAHTGQRPIEGRATEMLRTWTGISAAGKAGHWVTRSAWSKKFDKELTIAMRRNGVSDADINLLRDFVKTELPQALGSSAEHVQAAVWRAVSTGNPDAVRALGNIITPEKLREGAQYKVLSEFPHLPPKVRDVIKVAIAEGRVTGINAEDLLREIRENIVDWHRLSSEGLDQMYGEALRSIGTHEIATAAEAASSMRWLKSSGDTLGDLPRELSARAAMLAESAPPKRRAEIWKQLRDTIVEDVGRLRKTHAEMVERLTPKLKAVLEADETLRAASTIPQRASMATNLDNYMKMQVAISQNAADAAERIQKLADQRFGEVLPEDRNSAFWSQFRQDVSAIWNDELETRIDFLQDANDAWLGMFEHIDAGRLRPREREFMKHGIAAAHGDAQQRVDDIRHALSRWEQRLATVSENKRPDVERRIAGLNARLNAAADHERRLASRLAEFDIKRRNTTPAALRDVERGIRAQEAAIRETRKLLASNPAMISLIPNMESILNQAVVERQRLIADMIPADLRGKYEQMVQTRDILTQELNRTTERARAAFVQKQLNRANAVVKRFEGQITRGETVREAGQIGSVTLRDQQEAALAALQVNGGQLPATLEDMEDILIRLSDSGDPRVTGMVAALSDTTDMAPEVLQRIYTLASKHAARPALTPVQQSVMREVYEQGAGGVFPTRTLVELSELGFVEGPRALAGTGKVTVTLTEEGQALLDSLPTSASVDNAAFLESLDPPGKEFISTVDNMAAEAQDALSRLINVADNPPMRDDQIRLAQSYYNRVAKQMESQPGTMDKFRTARVEAAKTTNTEWKKAFVDYDTQNNFDFIMQRFVPFWMYASRRMPRLIRLAGKRPVLGKYFTQIALDSEFGHIATPWGDDFNPAKGTLAGTLRRTASPDFPSHHSGWRGVAESGQDWMGRLGLGFQPPITAALSALSGEPASLLPPPVSLLMYGIEGAGGNLPGGFDQLAFNGRWVQANMDKVIAEKWGLDPVTLHRQAEEGDEEAMAKLQIAQMETARVMIRSTQLSVFKYHPAGERAYEVATEQLIEDIIGIPKDIQEQHRRLGIPLSTFVPISRFQRQALREAMGADRYEAWVSADIAFLPAEEQQARRTINKFWDLVSRREEEHNRLTDDLDRRWQEGFVTGPEFREELSNLKRIHAYEFDQLIKDSEFSSVAGGIGIPLTPEQIQQWQQKFNSPPPLVHPVDEVLNRYHRIDPEQFRNPLSGEIDFASFFEAQESVLAEAPEPIRAIAEHEINSRARTPGERALALSKDKLREYYGVRDEIVAALSERNPVLVENYKRVRQLTALSKKATTPEERDEFRRAAIEMMARTPELAMLERATRDQRERLRARDPEMEMVYQMWISSGATPTGTTAAGGRGTRPTRGGRTTRSGRGY